MLSNSLIAVAALLANCVSGQVAGQTSPPKYPAPWINSDFDFEDPSPVPTSGRNWADAYDKAVQFVSKLTLLEKVNLTTGVGWEGGRCVGNTGSIPRLGFPGLCNQDSPLGVRDSEINGPRLFSWKSSNVYSGRKLSISCWYQCRINLEPEPHVCPWCGHGSGASRQRC
jgi:hypothetical protein